MNPLAANRLLAAYVLGAPLVGGLLAGPLIVFAPGSDLVSWPKVVVLGGLAAWIWSRYRAPLERRLGWVGVSAGDVVRLGVPTLAATLALGVAMPGLASPLLWAEPPDRFGSSALVADLLYLVLLAPLLEEWLFRGLLLQSYARARGGVFALWATSVLFALLHPGPSWFAFSLLMGWMLGRWVLSGGSLKAAFWVHLTNNALAVGVYPFLPEGTLGPVGPAAALALLAVAAAVVVRFSRRHRLPVERPERPAPVFSLSLGLVLLLGVLAQGTVLFFH